MSKKRSASFESDDGATRKSPRFNSILSPCYYCGGESDGDYTSLGFCNDCVGPNGINVSKEFQKTKASLETMLVVDPCFYCNGESDGHNYSGFGFCNECAGPNGINVSKVGSSTSFNDRNNKYSEDENRTQLTNIVMNTIATLADTESSKESIYLHYPIFVSRIADISDARLLDQKVANFLIGVKKVCNIMEIKNSYVNDKITQRKNFIDEMFSDETILDHQLSIIKLYWSTLCVSFDKLRTMEFPAVLELALELNELFEMPFSELNAAYEIHNKRIQLREVEQIKKANEKRKRKAKELVKKEKKLKPQVTVEDPTV